MFKNKNIEKKLFVLLKGDRWDLLKDFFGQWYDDYERNDKCMLWGHFFLDHYFRNPSPDFHMDLIKRFFSHKNEYTAAPRGFSKTTILQACCDFSIVNNLDKFIVIIEKTFTEAAEVIKGIHDEFVDNEKIQIIYGQLINKVTEEIKAVRLAKNPEARGDIFVNGIRVRGKGFNSNIRGLKTRQWRPTRIILDDVEEDEHINNPEQRKKYENNYNKGIQPASDINGTIKVFGTILHQDSLLKNLVDSHFGKIYRAHEGSDPATAPAESFLWPDRWSREKLIAKRNDMMSSGQSTSAYAQEYLNDPISDDERTFKFSWLWEMIPAPAKFQGNKQAIKKYRVPTHRITFDQFNKLRRTTTLNGYAMIDVADTTTDKADFTGAIVVFVDPHGNRYRVDVRREKRNIKEVIDLIFEIWERWSSVGLLKIGVEKKGFNDQILPLFEEEKRRRQTYPVLEELKPMGRNKENRIKGALQGFYEMGKIISLGRIDEDGYFKPVGNTNDLLEELYDFPSAKHDDCSDAEAYGGDIIVVPMADEEKRTEHHTPQDDPFENDRKQEVFYNTNPIGNFDDADPFE
jgi:hypothetical protein